MKTGRGTPAITWAIVAWTFAVTIARAIREPNDFAEAHWLLDYRFGIMKRGMIGSICSVVTAAFGGQMTPRSILVCSALTLVGMLAAMLVVLYRTAGGSRPRDDGVAAALVFASSPFIVMNAHLLGYLDAFLYLFTIAAIALVLRGRPLLAALVSSVAVLSHESYVVIGLPLVCLAALATNGRGEHGAGIRTHVLALSLPLLVFVAIPSLQALTTDPLTLRQQLTDRLNGFAFVADRSEWVAIWQTTTFLDFYRSESGAFSERLLDAEAWTSLGPSLLVLLIFIYSTFRVRFFSVLSVVLLGCVAAPLTMHAVAWDYARISAYTIGSAMLASWVLAETRDAVRPPRLFLALAMLVIALNLFGRMPLMDDEVERFSNAERLLLYLPVIALPVVFAIEAQRPQKTA